MQEIGAGEVAPYPAQGWLSGRLRGAAIAQRRTDLMSLWCGQSAPLLQPASAPDEFPAAADYLQRLVAETADALSRFRQPPR